MIFKHAGSSPLLRYGIVLFGTVCLFTFLLYRASRTVIFQEISGKHGIFLVVGKNNWPDGWDVSLRWKRPNEPWAVYYLDHESSYWREVQISQDGNYLIVSRLGKKEGGLNVESYSFENYRKNYTLEHPTYLILDSNPFANKKKYPDGAGWDSLWPKIIGDRIPDDWHP